MSNPVAQPPAAGVPAAPATGTQQVPAPVAPVAGGAAPTDPAAAPMTEGGDAGATEEQELLAMQLNSRFSIVKKTGEEEAGASMAGTQAPASPAAAPAGPPPPAAAPAPATLPPTTG
jgi:hypothetical protein